eukprot:403370925
MASFDQQQVESFLNFLIKNNIVDNSQDSETLSKYLNLFDQFQEQQDQDNEDGCNITQSLNGENDDSQIMFETRAIFTLADFLKSLTANEYYDISQKFYNQWAQQESKAHIDSLIKAVKIKEKVLQKDLQTAFYQWKQNYQFAQILEENEKLREYIYQISKENEMIQNEKQILELQTKKRNQISLNQIQPLRQSRVRQTSNCDTNRSNNNTNRSQTRQLAQSVMHGAFSSNDNLPIHERLHKEAYKKTQKQVINDVIKQHDELKDCTFKPVLSSQNSNVGIFSNQVTTPSSQSTRRTMHTNFSQQNTQQREDPFLFDRLSKSTKKFNPELLQLQKEQEEMKDCTFKPETNYKSKQIAEQRNCTDYVDKEQFFDRLYKEAENKEKFKKSLQQIKEQAEVNQCTFQPELLNSQRNNSIILSARKDSAEKPTVDAFSRLHQEHEQKQRSLIKIENEYEQKFKESHPFHPTRMAKQKDSKLCNRQESSQQRTSRLYDEWKDRERKIQDKRDELLKEEQKLCQLTLQTNGRKVKRQSIDNDNQTMQNNSHQNENSVSQILNTQNSQISQQTCERLYTNGKDKQRKQDELRDKIYQDQGYSFAPHTNTTSRYQVHKNVQERNKEFIERKENHIKEIQQQNSCEFKPQRVTKQSKLAQVYEKQPDNNENLSDKLYHQMVIIDQKKEKQRQEFSVDKNCTFKPQLAKKTEQILRESSQNRTMNGSTLTKSSASINFQQQTNENTHRQPFQLRNMNNM